MFKKITKKIVSGVLALTCVAACAGTLTACETSHPEAEITLSFNGETYKLNYTLYRKVAPATTKHFIWLVENGYYDGLCIHDYSNSRLYTGAFESTGEGNGLSSRNYFNFVLNSKNLSAFPHSVWEDREKNLPLYTLRGEFKNNSFEVTNGKLKPEFGALTMYYTENNASDDVYVEYASKEGMASRQYRYNSATSMFYISLKAESTSSSYCTFALLQDGEDEKLKELQADIEDYITDTYGEDEEDEFTTTKMVTVGEGDRLLENYEKNVYYNVPNSAIVIESIKITKY